MATANLPSPTKVSGKFNAIYEAYYKQLDPKGLGTIEAMVAAKFLKKSGLSDVVLSRIWDLSDPTGRGFLDKEGLFVSLKLVALAQAGHDIHMRNIFIEPPNPPKVGEIPKIQPPKIQTVLPHTQDWSIAPADRTKYEALFESLLPVDGLLPGNKVRTVLMDSKLPLDALSRIWDLADQDKDGSLDKHEFLVAMHLVYQALDKKTIPASLPVELQRPKYGAMAAAAAAPPADNGFVANFPADIAPPPVPPLPTAIAAHHTQHHHHQQHIPPLIPPMPMRPASVNAAPLIPTDLLIQTAPSVTALSSSSYGGSSGSSGSGDWVVSPLDKQRFDAMFKRSDLDNDGLVSGLEIKDVFLQSGIPQLCLAQIWALCDTAQSGKLTAEQFALAMWMVERKRIGYEPPECLAANMVPPSQRAPANSGGIVGAAADLVGLEANLMQTSPTAADQAYANPELAMIAKEIEELVRERRQLESEVTQREADIRIKNGEVRSLQSELDTLAATLKQLENQKGEAQKRLDDLKAQVNKIRDKCQKQEETIHEMEGEVDSKRGELQKLKDEESSLEREYDANKQELDKVSQFLQDTKLQISQIKSMVTQLQESQRQMSDALSICKSAIDTNNPTMVSDYTLRLEPEFREVRAALEKKEEKATEPDTTTETFKTNGFTPSDPFGASGANTTTTAGFATSFATPNAGGGFDDSFGNAFGQTRTDDPFQEASSAATGATLADPFGDKAGNKAITPDPNKDDFGSDPFAILHAPTSASQIISPGGPSAHMKSSAGAGSGGPPPRPESPSPALPPKKAKQPPPRPAPPRPSMGPTPTRPEPPSQGFGGSGAPAGGFADFANFDDITSTPPPPPPPQATATAIPTTNIFATANTTNSAIPGTFTATPTTAATSATLAAPAFAVGGAASAVVATALTTDFADDPFKDYRYEDPFNIKDPFDDDDDTITDNFASIVAVAPSPVPVAVAVASNLVLQPTGGTLNNGNITGTLPKHASPVPPLATGTSLSPSFANFNNQFGAATSVTRTADFFDTFHDNFNKNTITATATSTSNNIAGIVDGTNGTNGTNRNGIGIADAFASITNNTTTASSSHIDNAFGGSRNNVDAFGVPQSASAASAVSSGSVGGTLKKAKVDNTFVASFNNDFFATGFEDEFAAVKVPNASANQSVPVPQSSSSSSTTSDFAKLDAFGAAANGNSGGGNAFGTTSGGDDPFADARFDDSFVVPTAAAATTTSTAKVDNIATTAFPKRPNNNNNRSNGGNSSNSASSSSSQYDAGTAGAMVKGKNNADALKNPRYAADYSQGEAFDKDLQAALQRSMVDQ